MSGIRKPAVAGLFYPEDAMAVSSMIAMLLGDSSEKGSVPKAVIVPHAGWMYSGSMAALAYNLVASGRHQITKVVMVGPAHRVAISGLATCSCKIWRTPLGDVQVEYPQNVLDLPNVKENDTAHRQEHSLEVQVPFLQSVLDNFSIMPFVAGRATGEEVADVLDAVWGGPETLIVISSDLSHYLSYGQARELDRVTVNQINELRGPITHAQACGATPVNGLIEVAKRRKMSIQLLGWNNSGDTAGDKARVVGYSAFALYPLTSK